MLHPYSYLVSSALPHSHNCEGSFGGGDLKRSGTIQRVRVGGGAVGGSVLRTLQMKRVKNNQNFSLCSCKGKIREAFKKKILRLYDALYDKI